MDKEGYCHWIYGRRTFQVENAEEIHTDEDFPCPYYRHWPQFLSDSYMREYLFTAKSLVVKKMDHLDKIETLAYNPLVPAQRIFDLVKAEMKIGGFAGRVFQRFVQALNLDSSALITLTVK